MDHGSHTLIISSLYAEREAIATTEMSRKITSKNFFSKMGGEFSRKRRENMANIRMWFNKIAQSAGESSQWSATLAYFPEDSGSIFITHSVALNLQS